MASLLLSKRLEGLNMIRYEKLWQLLKKKHIDVDEFLKYLRFDDYYIERIKNGDPITSSHLNRICCYLDVKLYEIIEFV